MLKTAAGILLGLAAIPFSAAAFSFSVATAPDWDDLFQRTNGWIGSDVAFSIPLATNKTLWIFGDTLVGDVVDNSRTNVQFIHSSIATQIFGDAPEFFYPTNQNGAAQSFIKSPNNKSAFWLLDGERNDRGLFFFMQQVQFTGGGAFGFSISGNWLASVKNPDDSPANWEISATRVPFAYLAGSETVTFGIATMKANGFIYIYGVVYRQETSFKKSLILARVPENQLGDFHAWQFSSHGHWVNNFMRATPVFSNAPAEGSVSWQPLLNKYVFVYTDGIGGNIVMRTADAPQGPWSTPTSIYQCPEMSISPNVICYAGKGHPELSDTNELLISYASNSLSFTEVLDDTRLYFPRFIRVTFTQ